MSTTPTKRFRSTFHDINLELLKKLCDIHPWTRGELCKAVDMEPAVLSMVLAGKRPLPGRVAKQFLGLMGMKEDGSLDSNHLFLFVARPGREEEVLTILGKIFFSTPKPQLPFNCQIKATFASPDPEKPPILRTGFAFFNGSAMAVVHAGADSKVADWWNTGRGFITFTASDPEVLLSTEVLPTRSDLLKAFHGSGPVANPTWNEVIEAAKRRNVEPREVMSWLEANYSVPIDANPDGLQ